MATTQVTKTFRPNTVGPENNWNLVRGSNKVVAVDPGEPIVHDDNGTRIRNATMATDKQSFKIDREFPESMGTINALRVHCRARGSITNAGVKLGVSLDPGTCSWTLSSELNVGTSAAYITRSVALGKPGGGSWTETDLRDTTFQYSVEPDSASAPDLVDVTSLWVEVDYLPTDESAGAIPPEFPSKKLRRSRLPLGVLESKMRADVLDVDLLEDFDCVHSQGPAKGTSGWTVNNPKRLRVIQSDLNLNTMEVTLKAIDLHNYVCMFWHTGQSPYNIRSDEQYPDGPGILHPGATETFTRASKGWILDGSDKIAELSSDNKRIGPNGLLIEKGNANVLRNSAFFENFAYWNRSSTDYTALDSTVKLFYDAVATGLGGTNQTAKLTGSSCDHYIMQMTTGHAINAGETFRFVIWHKDNSTKAPKVRLHSTAISKDWDNATTAWVNPVHLNTLESSTSNWIREKIISREATSGNNTLPECYIYSPTNDFTHIGQVQIHHVLGLGGGAIDSSPIPTLSSAASLAAESLKFSSNTGRRTLSAEAGTILLRCRFPYGYSPAASIDTGIEHFGVPLAAQYYDSNDWLLLAYNPPSDFAFALNSNGTRQQANSSTVTVSTNVSFDIAARWTSTNGELGLPSRTLSIFVNGAKGTDVQHTCGLVADSSGALWLGSGPNPFGDNLQSYGVELSHIEILPWAMTCAEIKERP